MEQLSRRWPETACLRVLAAVQRSWPRGGYGGTALATEAGYGGSTGEGGGAKVAARAEKARAREDRRW
jgi:hypothetical protein